MGAIPTVVLLTNKKKNIMNERLEFYGKEIIEFYTYRTARCMHSMFIELSVTQKQDLRQYLGSKMDNHITWRTNDLCYTYSDGFLYIGTSIKVMKW